MTSKKNEEPISPDEVRALITDPNTRITIAARQIIEVLEPYMVKAVAAICQISGIKSVIATDETYLSDFFGPFNNPSAREDYDALANALGIEISDNMPLVKVAAKLKAKATPNALD